ncbi:MAG: hypothetical protein H0S85_02830 [Desulfovibrionaceae bacterium]|nr:hypothetical protein [Desulfovibrionaceae bacterium]
MLSAAEAIALGRAALDRAALVGVEEVDARRAAGRVLAEPVYALPARCGAPSTDTPEWAGEDAECSDSPDFQDSLGAPDSPDSLGSPNSPDFPDATSCEDALFLGTASAPGGGELLLPAGHLVTPQDEAALVLAGVARVRVQERVRMVFIPSGDEVLPFRARPTPGPGQVVESNSRMFTALARAWGAEAESLPPVRDDFDALLAAVCGALAGGAHVVVLGAGTARGTRDHSLRVLRALGRVVVDGVALVPGKSGRLAVAAGRLLVNVPGPPTGAAAFLEEILRPLADWLGHRPGRAADALPAGLPPIAAASADCPSAAVALVRARMVCRIRSRPGLTRLVRVALSRVDGELAAVPLDGRHSGMLASMTVAGGLLRLSPQSAGVVRGEWVDVEPGPWGPPPDQVLFYAADPEPLPAPLVDALLAQDPPVRPVRVHDGEGFAGPEAALDLLANGDALLAVLRVPGVSGPAGGGSCDRDAFGGGADGTGRGAPDSVGGRTGGAAVAAPSASRLPERPVPSGSPGATAASVACAVSSGGFAPADGGGGGQELARLVRLAEARGLAVRVVVAGARRIGLVVARGNPLGICVHADPAHADLARPDVAVVDLAEGCAGRLGVAARAGTERTAGAVAACVAAGLADCGPGDAASARGHGLDFVPLGWERLVFVALESRAADPRVRAALRAARAGA